MKQDLKSFSIAILAAFFIALFINGSVIAKPIVITNSATFPPFSFLDDEGKPQGLLIDIWNEWALKNNQEIQFKLVDWNESLELIRKGEADIHAGLFLSKSRKSYMDFSDELFQLTTGLFVSSSLNIQSIEELKDTEVGVTKDGFEEEYLRANFPSLRLRLFNNNEQLVQSASSGEIRTFVADYPVGMYYLHRNNTPENFRVLKILYSNPLHGAVQKGDKKILTLVNSGLRQIDGAEKERILQKWIRSEQVVPAWFIPFLLSAVIVIILVGLLLYVFFLQRNKIHLKRLVEQRTRELQESEVRFRLLISNLPKIAVQGYDSDRNVMCWNRASEILYGYSEEEAMGKRIEDLIIPPAMKDMVISAIHNWLEHDVEIPSNEFVLRHKDGSDVVVYSSHVMLSTMQNEKEMYCVDINLADLKLAQKKKDEVEVQLQRAQKMEAIGLLAGGVAHDLNNILTGITGYPELMLLQLPDDSELIKPLEAIKESGERAAAVVADLLTVARGVASSKTVNNMNSLIAEYFDSPEYHYLHTQHQYVKATLELGKDLPNFICSPVHIKKCIMNLVTNGVEAISNSGSITLSTTSVQPDVKWLKEHGMALKEYILLSITDTGMGISKKDINHIFEPFYTKKVMGRSGTGLGLAVVWNTIEDHEGRIFVESSEKGTCFQLYFPISDEECVKQANESQKEKLIGNKEHILVIDDEPHLRDIACQMLLASGYHVDSVSSGEAAITFIKNNPVDLVVLDMLMEPGINGYQTYKEILTLYPNQKAIIASGFSESKDVKATLILGASGFVKKPYSMDQLGRAVQEALIS